MSGSPHKSRPRVSAPKPSANTDLWIIGILFPILVVGGWFGWQVYERITLQTKLPPKANRGLIDSLAGVFRPVEATETKTEIPLVVIVPPKPTVEPIVVVPPKVIEEPLPPLSLQPYPFTGPDLRDPQRLATLLKDTKARTFDGKWESHSDRVKYGLYPALTGASKNDGFRRFDRLWDSPYFALGMTQYAFIQRVTPATLRAFIAQEETLPFLQELMADSGLMEKFLANIKAEDNAGEAIKVWAKLVADDSKELKGKYVNLQLAVALVFDRKFSFRRARDPMGESFTVNPIERYRYFRDNAQRQRLETDIKRLEPYELVWVVSAEATAEEMEWALKENDLKRLKLATADQKNDWSEAYPMINYRMDFVTGAKPPKAPPGKKAYKPQAESFTRGTLEEIHEVGGICMDQSHFGTTAARAFGIPAASVGGDGNRGGHAWFAYMMPTHQWNMGNSFHPFSEPRNLPGTGRYADGYANGHTRDPQTGKGIGEFEVQLTGDPERRMSEHYPKSLRLRFAAKVFQGNKDQEGQLECLQFSTQVAKMSLDAWLETAACLEAMDTKISYDRWREFVKSMRSAFHVSDEDRRWLDMIKIADDFAEKHVWTDPKMTGEQVYMECKNSYNQFMSEKKRLRGQTFDKTRYDLIVVSIERIGRQLAKDKSAKGQENLFFFMRQGLKDNLEHLPTFRSLLDNFYLAVKGNATLELSFLREIRRLYQNEMSDTGNDVFRMKTVLGLIDTMQPYFDKCNQPDMKKEFERDKAKIQKELDKLKKQ
ncbi:MAG: hypothetical protein CK522_00730 [Opitutia bacterium]|nr:MAG: hypothetical protein CK522_00730 [Opitutae bacterium]